MLGFAPVASYFLSSVTIFKKVCRVCVCDMGPTLTSAVQFCLIKLSIVTHVHTFMHTYMHLDIHAYTVTYTHTFMHMRTYRGHLYATASTTLSLDSTKSKKRNETKQQNVIPSVSNPKISPSIHFKWQVPQTVSLQNTFLFPQYLIEFYLTNTTFTAFYPCLALQQ